MLATARVLMKALASIFLGGSEPRQLGYATYGRANLASYAGRTSNRGVLLHPVVGREAHLDFWSLP